MAINTTKKKSLFEEWYEETNGGKDNNDKKDEDIAPFYPSKSGAGVTLVSPQSTEKEKSSWQIAPDPKSDLLPSLNQARKKYQGFSDGYQFGDISRTLAATGEDFLTSMGEGLWGIGEGLFDTAAYTAAGVAERSGNDEFAQILRKAAQQNFVQQAATTERKSANFGGNVIDEASVLGEKGRAFGQGLGQIIGIMTAGGAGQAAGLGAKAVTALTTAINGLSSTGSGMSEAYADGATDEEAAAYGIISGIVNAGSELLFGGLGKALNAVGISRGISSLDDAFAKKLSNKISNHFVKTAVQYGVKAGAEGLEEVLAGIGEAVGKKFTYMKDESIWKLLRDEKLLEQFAMGAVLSGVAQIPDVSSSIKNKTDFITGQTAEQEAATKAESNVVESLIKEKIAEAEKSGKALTAKAKNEIRKGVEALLERGEIAVEDIERILGGETYTKYKADYEGKKARVAEIVDQLQKIEKHTVGKKNKPKLNARFTELQQELQQLTGNKDAETLYENMRGAVRDSALGSRLSESYTQRAARGQKFEADLSKYSKEEAAIVKKAADSGILNNTRRTHELVDLLAKVSAEKGIDFDFTSNEKLKNSVFAVGDAAVNGYWNGKGITLNVNSKKTWNTVLGHEITHVFEGTELYNELKTAITEYAKSKGDYDGRLKALTELYKDVKDADVEGELVADLVGDYIFGDEAFVRQLSVQNRNLFQKIFDEIKWFCKKATAGSEQAKQFEDLKKLFEKVYRESEVKAAEGTRYSFSAINPDPNGYQLEDAERLELEGKSSEEIRQQTGWFRSYDDKWRYEIDDSKAVWHFDTAQPDPERLFYFGEKVYKLGDILEHEELYKAYPQLKDVTVYVSPNLSVDAAVMSGSTDSIAIKSLTDGFSKRRLLIHEIQHIIQNIEGFAKGASKFEYTDKEWTDKEYEALDKRNEVAKKLYAVLRRNGESLSNEDIYYSQHYSRIHDDVIESHYFQLQSLATNNKRTQALIDEYYDQVQILNATTPEGQYHATAGEIEAYDTMGRMQMSAEERKAVRPNIDRTDVIVKGVSEVATDQHSIKKTSQMSFNDQLKQIERKQLNGSNSLYIGTPAMSLQSVGLSNAPFAMNQSDYRKSRRKTGNNKNYSSHAVPLTFFEKMPQYLADAPMLIDNGAKVSVVTSFEMKDTNGNASYVIAGVWTNQQMDNDTINQVKSVYPLDDFASRIKEAAESGKLVVINTKKAEQMLATIGVQPSELSRILDFSKSIISQNSEMSSGFAKNSEVKELDGGTVTKYSLSTWTPETQTKVRDNLIKAGYDTAKVDSWIKDTNSVAAVIAADKDRLDFEAADNQVMLKDNQEYIKTLDASTLCAKRLIYQGTFDAIQHRMPNTMLTSDDLIELLNMMKEHGVQTPCGVCYVESRRRHLGKFAQEWLNGYNGAYKPSLDEVTTSDGLEKLRKTHPDTYKAFMDAMNKKGSSNPKVVQLRTEYRNEIMSLTPSQIRNIEAIGGLRVQSFSDFETPHMLDMMQAVMDMSAKGLHSQAYTKVPNFAWIFGDTGIKINLSLIAEGDGFDADGNLAFSSTEGMDFDEAMRIRDAYSANVGTIIVGANDQHILACMADDRIDFIIPFHRSGWGMKELHMMGMDSYTDYTYGQKEHDLATGKGIANLYPPDYWDYSLTGKENAERYLKLCAQTGREPKFSKFLVDNGDGSYSLQPDGSTDGYWKTLIDFKMYDNNGVGVPQQTVQPIFNMEQAYRVLDEYEGGANELPVANDVVDEFVAKYNHSNEIAPTKWSLSKQENADAEPIAFNESVRYQGDIAPLPTARKVTQTTPKKVDNLPIREDIAPLPKANAEVGDIAPVPATGGKRRSFATTAVNSDTVQGQVLFEDLDQAVAHYEPIPNAVTLTKADNKLSAMGYQKSVDYFNGQMNARKVALEDIALGERLIQESIARGDTKTAGELIQNMAILGTELGQKVQALSIIKRLTPEGQVLMLDKIIQRGKTRGDHAYDGVEFTQDMKDHILKVYDTDGAYDQDALNAAVEDVKQRIADQMKVSLMDKVNAWRYLSMLGNPKTHIRNVVSNVAMRYTVAVKNAVARTVEDIAPIKNKTKTWRRATQSVKTYADNMAAEMRDVISDGGKYNEEASIKDKRKMFKVEVLDKVYEFNNDMLSKEDWWFSKAAYRDALSEYLTANGIKTFDDINKNPKIVEKGKQYALEQSQIATFRQASWLANKIGEIERKNAATEIAVGAVLPFKKTPINIAKTALNYSPLGFTKTLTYDIAQVKNGKMEASQLVDHLSQNLTGTGLTVLGYLLASIGFINGAGDDDKEGKYDYQLGKQAYSINIGDATYSLSWLSPVAMPLFVGANAYEQLVEKNEWNGDVVMQTLAQTLDPLSEMSFLSSLDDVLSSYDSGVEKFASIGVSAAQSYISQFIPTLSSQVASVLDSKKRTTKVSADSGFKAVEETINELMYKIPLLRNTLEPSTDIWGQTVKQNDNFVGRAFETFLAPYSKKELIATEIDTELKRLYSETGENGVIPSIPGNTFTYQKVKYEMSAEEYTDYKMIYGQTANILFERLFATKEYQRASDKEKAKMVSKVYDIAKEDAREYILEGREGE